MPKASLKQFLSNQRNLGKVIRFSAKTRLKDESVAEHSFHVAFYAMMLADLELKDGRKINIERLLRSALLHDLEECVTGDILHDFKHRDRRLNKEIKRIASRFYMELMQSLPRGMSSEYYRTWSNAKNEKTAEGKLLHAADRLDALLYSMEEYHLGNKTFRPIIDEIVKSLKEMKLKSVDYFLKELGF
ncbi:MAG: HD domain-containing protein [Candidatus Aenigmarchaeota archaeon]|nr:HD domain-containing protein [Candidatus Aenigmarchaeota archaeon]